jgi:hypothetical protein
VIKNVKRFLTCSAKVMFNTEQSAKAAARKIKKRGGPVMYWYKCPYCQGYHLTKQKQR